MVVVKIVSRPLDSNKEKGLIGIVVVPVHRIRTGSENTEGGWYEVRGTDSEPVRSIEGASKIELAFVHKPAPQGLQSTEGFLYLGNSNQRGDHGWAKTFLTLDPYNQYLKSYKTAETVEGTVEIVSLVREFNLRYSKVTEAFSEQALSSNVENIFVVSNSWEELTFCCSNSDDKVRWMQAIEAIANPSGIRSSPLSSSRSQRKDSKPMPQPAPANQSGRHAPSRSLSPSTRLGSHEGERAQDYENSTQNSRQAEATTRGQATNQLTAQQSVDKNLARKFEAARRALGDYLARIQELEQETKRLQEEGAQSQEQSNKLIALLNEKNKSLNESLDAAIQQNKELERVLNSKVHLDDQRSQESDWDVRFAELHSQLDIARQALLDQDRRERELLRVQEEQKAMLANLQDVHQQTTKPNHSDQQSEVAAQSELAALRTHLTELQNDMQTMMLVRQNQDLEIEKLKAAKQVDMKALTSAFAEIEELRNELVDQLREKQSLVNAQNKSNDDISDYRLTQARYLDEIADLEIKLHESWKINEIRLNRIDDLETELLNTQRTLAASEQLVAKLSLQIQGRDEQSQSDASRYDQMRSTLAQLSAEKELLLRRSLEPRENGKYQPSSVTPTRGAYVERSDPEFLSAAVPAEEPSKLIKARALVADITATLSKRASSSSSSPFSSHATKRVDARKINDIIPSRPDVGNVQVSIDDILRESLGTHELPDDPLRNDRNK